MSAASFTRVDRLMFALSALYTCSIALAVIIAPGWTAKAFYLHHLQPGEVVLGFLAADFGGLLLFFGIGYGLVAVDPAKNRALVWLGAVGKVAVFASMTQRFLAGTATALALSVGTGDLIFAALYAHFLWRMRASARAG